MRTAHSLPYRWVSVLAGGLCPGGSRGLCSGGSLSGVLCPGVLCPGGDLCQGDLLPWTEWHTFVKILPLFAGGNKINYTEQPEEKVYVDHVISNFRPVTR